MKVLKIVFLTLLIISNPYLVFADEAPDYSHGFIIDDWKIYTYHNSYKPRRASRYTLEEFCGEWKENICKETELSWENAKVIDSSYIYKSWWLLVSWNVTYAINKNWYSAIKWIWEYQFYIDDRNYIIVNNYETWESRLYKNKDFDSWYIKLINTFDTETLSYEIYETWNGDSWKIWPTLIIQDSSNIYLNTLRIDTNEKDINVKDIIFIYWTYMISIRWEIYLLVNWKYIQSTTPAFSYTQTVSDTKWKLPIINDWILTYRIHDDSWNDWWIRTNFIISSEAKEYIKKYINSKTFEKEKVVDHLEELKVPEYKFKHRDWVDSYTLKSTTYAWITKEVILAYVLKFINEDYIGMNQ